MFTASIARFLPLSHPMGACNQGEKFQDFYCVSSGTLRALCYWRKYSPVELKIITVIFSS